MMRTLLALLGLAVLLAVFAGVHYGRAGATEHEWGQPAFQLAPGEVRSVMVQPSLPGHTVDITLVVTGDAIDVYTMDSSWAATLARRGLALDRPFSYHLEWSQTHVEGRHEFSIVSDGRTGLDILLDHSDNYYDGDAMPDGQVVTVDLAMRYTQREQQSLVLGYLATVPSIVLVVLVVWRQAARARQRRQNR